MGWIHLKNSLHIFISLLFVMLVSVACNSSDTKETANNNDNEETVEENKDDLGDTEVDEASDLSSLGDYEVYLTGEVTEADEQILIEGESNLLPGAKVIGEVKVVDKNVSMYLFDSTEDLDFHTEDKEVIDEDGKFQIELEHPKTEDEIFVSVKFDMSEQDDDIIEHYGEQGENLEGPYVYQHVNLDGYIDLDTVYQKAEVRTSFIPDEDHKAMRQFEEPNWTDIPEDIGDTDVWIEVDEINDDLDYYYIQGRSNLIEGTRLMIKPGLLKVAETAVEKDGTFHFKINYEDLGDKLVILFDPNDFQWGLVEETYGKKGQKITGDLVGPDITEKRQIVTYEQDVNSHNIDVPDNIEVEMDGSEITLLVPDDILFDFDEYELKDKSKETLKEISDLLENSFNKDDLVVEIEGHTDSTGDAGYNQDLSEKRANEVKNHFEKEVKDSKVTFTTKGYGAQKPVASNDTESGQAKNRRVEIIVDLK